MINNISRYCMTISKEDLGQLINMMRLRLWLPIMSPQNAGPKNMAGF